MYIVLFAPHPGYKPKQIKGKREGKRERKRRKKEKKGKEKGKGKKRGKRKEIGKKKEKDGFWLTQENKLNLFAEKNHIFCSGGKNIIFFSPREKNITYFP